VDKRAGNGDDAAMELMHELDIRPGITSVVGSGGKTTLLAALARELGGTVALTTTTHIRPFPGVETFARAPFAPRVGCVGAPADDGKLAAPAQSPEEIASYCRYVLVEADGSRGLPLKAHAAWEPVIPAGSTQTILVVGASGFGHPVREVAHRPEIFCAAAGCDPDDIATPELVSRVLRAEAFANRLVVNQADTPELIGQACELGELMGIPYWAGSLNRI
jgi:probable selenium-dependent hydroxylase accessory protein YqeC